MKVLSIWQPWASLIVLGHKSIETRGWPAPRSIIGTRIGIASTKSIQRAQRAAAGEVEIQPHYKATGLPPLDKLPMGCLLGTVLVTGCKAIDRRYIETLSDLEQALGWYEAGRYAWLLAEPKQLVSPTRIVGSRRLWDWPHELPA